MISKHKQTVITKHMNFKFSGQEINTTTSVKYLGVLGHTFQEPLS